LKGTKKIICICCSLIVTASLVGCNGVKDKSSSLSDITSIKFTDFSKDISADSIYSTIEKLSAKDDARITGFDGEKDSASYISKEFKDMGLSVDEQEFPVTAFKCDNAEIKINSPESKIVGSKALTFSKETPKDGLTSEVVNGYMGTQTDLEKAKVKDKLVIIQRGGDTFKNKTERAAAMGAVGVMFFDPNSEEPISATLVEPTKIPAVSISKADAEYISSTIITSEKGLKATIKVDSQCIDSKSKNIIATLKSKKKNAKTLIVGAHYDGVDTPAANDNASGISTIMESARILSKKNLDCNIKFIAFGAEEIGLVGSNYYVQSLNSDDLQNTIAMINADMVGIGDNLCVYTMDSSKDSLTADLAVSCMNDFQYDNRRDESNRSDHVAFEAAGIPVAYFEYGPFVDYHTDKDTADKINKENLSNTCNVITSLCNEIGNNPERFSK
jgi:aminopeptidase YwaD